MQEDLVYSSLVLHVHYRGLSNYTDSKARCFPVNLNALAYSCPNRTYAITMKNKWVAGILYTVSAAEFGIGVYMLIWAALNSRKYLRSITYARAPELRKGFTVPTVHPVPLDEYNMCIPNIKKTFTLIQMSLSLAFGRYPVTLPTPIP